MIKKAKDTETLLTLGKQAPDIVGDEQPTGKCFGPQSGRGPLGSEAVCPQSEMPPVGGGHGEALCCHSYPSGPPNPPCIAPSSSRAGLEPRLRDCLLCYHWQLE